MVDMVVFLVTVGQEVLSGAEKLTPKKQTPDPKASLSRIYEKTIL